MTVYDQAGAIALLVEASRSQVDAGTLALLVEASRSQVDVGAIYLLVEATEDTPPVTGGRKYGPARAPFWGKF